jgi:hypothetical protein
LSQEEQLGYIDAVKCMMSTPGRTSSLYSGVVSAYDDYQALHIAMTEHIHFNVRNNTMIGGAQYSSLTILLGLI